MNDKQGIRNYIRFGERDRKRIYRTGRTMPSVFLTRIHLVIYVEYHLPMLAI